MRSSLIGTRIILFCVAGLAGVTAIALCQDKTRTVSDGVYTANQADHGQSLYQANCAPCHSDDLGGGEGAPPLTGPKFLSTWQGKNLGDLFDRIRTTMPADTPGSLSPDQNAEIVAFILKVNQFPAGSVALPHQSELLKEIRMADGK
jgi:S-disulfanyl-L-cysteine oxidoreductase SoxD